MSSFLPRVPCALNWSRQNSKRFSWPLTSSVKNQKCPLDPWFDPQNIKTVLPKQNWSTKKSKLSSEALICPRKYQNCPTQPQLVPHKIRTVLLSLNWSRLSTWPLIGPVKSKMSCALLWPIQKSKLSSSALIGPAKNLKMSSWTLICPSKIKTIFLSLH